MTENEIEKMVLTDFPDVERCTLRITSRSGSGRDVRLSLHHRMDYTDPDSVQWAACISRVFQEYIARGIDARVETHAHYYRRLY